MAWLRVNIVMQIPNAVELNSENSISSTQPYLQVRVAVTSEITIKVENTVPAKYKTERVVSCDFCHYSRLLLLDNYCSPTYFVFSGIDVSQ